MTTTLQLLGTQHHDVLARLAAVEADIVRSDASSLSSFATYLEAEVMHHFVVEEQALFPLLEPHLGATHGPLAVMHAEHAEFRDLLQSLVAAVRDGAPPTQCAHAESIIALLRGHIAKEDQVLFPMAARVLSTEELSEVDRRTIALKG
jgi:hemerythrin-like domain-containing protein